MTRKYQVTVSGKTHDVEVLSSSSRSLSLRIDQKDYEVSVSAASKTIAASSSAPSFATPTQSAPAPSAAQDSDTLYAPMPGLVVSVDVKEGDSVSSGAQLLTLEAMKMENGVNAPKDATVKEILVKKGEQVEAGSPLIKFE